MLKAGLNLSHRVLNVGGLSKQRIAHNVRFICPPRLHGDKDKSAGDEEMVLRIESGDASVVGEKWTNALYLAADSDPFALVERAVAAAAAMSGELQTFL